MLAALAARYLERRGHVVIEPDFLAGEDVYANIGPFTLFRRTAPYKVVPAATPILPSGYRAVPMSARILPPGCAVKRERPPKFVTYTPMIGTSEPRTVVGIMGDEVTYRTPTVERTVKIGTFNDWRRDVGARVG